MMRHLERLSSATEDALNDETDDLLRKQRLRRIQPSMPNLSASWLFQRAMSVKPGSKDSGYLINDLLWNNMSTMMKLGDDVMRPFLQDVIQAGPLTKTLLAMTFSNPGFALKLLGFLGPKALVQWLPHYFSLILYSNLSRVGQLVEPAFRKSSLINRKEKFSLKRRVEEWMYGSGRDYEKPATKP